MYQIIIILSSSSEKLSLGFATMYGSNRPAQLQILARIMKNCSKQV